MRQPAAFALLLYKPLYKMLLLITYYVKSLGYNDYIIQMIPRI